MSTAHPATGSETAVDGDDDTCFTQTMALVRGPSALDRLKNYACSKEETCHSN